MQTMTKVPTRDPDLVLRQIGTLVDITPDTVSERSRALLEAMRLWDKFISVAPVRCDLVRCAVPDMESAQALRRVVRDSPVPVVADVHFDYRLALTALESGVHKIRINPGNLGGEGPTRIVAEACRVAGVPIRVGVNAGSLEKDLRGPFEQNPAEALAESAIRNVELLEGFGFSDLVVSVKAASAAQTIAANRLLSERTECPIHVGVTEAGVGTSAMIASIVGIGALLNEGIGDTLRVSLTEDPDLEVVLGALIVAGCSRPKNGGWGRRRVDSWQKDTEK